MMGELRTQLEAAFKDFKGNNKYWALMLFNTELELGISNSPGKWVNTGNIYYKDGLSALNGYANISNPASQLIDAKSIEELQIKMEEMIVNFQDNKWLEKNLYPYIM